MCKVGSGWIKVLDYGDVLLPPPGGDGLGCRTQVILPVTEPELSPIPPVPKVRSSYSKG